VTLTGERDTEAELWLLRCPTMAAKAKVIMSTPGAKINLRNFGRVRARPGVVRGAGIGRPSLVPGVVTGAGDVVPAGRVCTQCLPSQRRSYPEWCGSGCQPSGLSSATVPPIGRPSPKALTVMERYRCNCNHRLRVIAGLPTRRRHGSPRLVMPDGRRSGPGKIRRPGAALLWANRKARHGPR